MRGTSIRDARRALHRRLTPAGAGNIETARGSTCSRRAHPRRCGEHPVDEAYATLDPGSPPQVRGTSPLGKRRYTRHRLTPAGAGNISASPASSSMRGAHPRRCGEHPSRIPVIRTSLGSPPQVRGTSGGGRDDARVDGLTPAGAGNISAPPLWLPRTPAHPRRCGEHGQALDGTLTVGGSPPQVRGTSRIVGWVYADHGLTPAGAGNIECSAVVIALSQAHPRRCGEHPGGVEWDYWLTGLTPAGAGNIPTSGSQSSWRRAHPRRCGEHPGNRTWAKRLSGSPPQVRGTFDPQIVPANLRGLTPAGAGNIGR